MPRKTRLKKRPRLSDAQAAHLQLGMTFDLDLRYPSLPNRNYPFESEDHRRELWFKNRQNYVEFTGDFLDIDTPRKPGDIPPAAWFDYEVKDAPECFKTAQWHKRQDAWKALSEKQRLAWHKRFVESEPPVDTA